MAANRLVVLVSGGGTTLQNLLDRTADGRLDARIVGVVCSKAGAKAIDRANAAGVPVEVVEPDRKGSAIHGVPFGERVWSAVRAFSPDLVILGGWLHLLPIPDDYRGRVLNIHPSLLPAFGGKGMYGHRVHEAVIASGATESGCTVHFADDAYDTGPIVLQRAVRVRANDTPDDLAARVFEAECEAYPEAIRQVLDRLRR